MRWRIGWHGRGLAALAVLVVLAAGCGGVRFSENVVRASGEIVEDDRELEPFTAVSVEGPVEVTVIADGTHRVELRMDRELERLAMITTDDGEFELDFPNRMSVRGPIVAELVLHVERLDDVEVSGAAQLTFDRMEGEVVRVGVSGASELVGGSIDGGVVKVEASGASDIDATVDASGETEVDASGASRVTLEGTTAGLTIEAGGASTLDVGGISAADADVELNGASSAWVTASGTITGDLGGASTLHAAGDASLSVETSGASSVIRD